MTIARKMEMTKYLNLQGRTRGRFVLGGPDAAVYYEDGGVSHHIPDKGLEEIYEAKLGYSKAKRQMIIAEIREHGACAAWLDGAILQEHEVAMSTLDAIEEDGERACGAKTNNRKQGTQDQ